MTLALTACSKSEDKPEEPTQPPVPAAVVEPDDRANVGAANAGFPDKNTVNHRTAYFQTQPDCYNSPCRADRDENTCACTCANGCPNRNTHTSHCNIGAANFAPDPTNPNSHFDAIRRCGRRPEG